VSVKVLLRRVGKLEPKPSKMPLKLGGSVETFESVILAGIEAAKYDERDLPVVMACIKRWARTS
jgi:hypothetical protein